MRTHPALTWLVVSVGLLCLLIGMLIWNQPRSRTSWIPPLSVHVAASNRIPLEVIAKQYTEETGQVIELSFGGTQSLLSSIEVSQKGDVLIPADEQYTVLAKEKNLIADVFPLARMKAVLLVAKDSPSIHTWQDLLRHPIRLAQANPEVAAIGKLTQQRFLATGDWTRLHAQTMVFKGNVNDVANAVQIGSVDAGIVWDAVAHAYPELTVVHLPELDSITAQVQVCVLTTSQQPEAAKRFAAYVAAKQQRRVFEKSGFQFPDKDKPSAP